MIRDEPIISRIREVRRQIQEECGNDVHRMFLYYVELQRRYADRVVCWNVEKTKFVPYRQNPE